MQRRVSAFKNYTIEAPDGNVGYVSDILFEDNDWNLRWFVIEVGSWLSGRKLLIHPAALGRPDIRLRAFPVALTKAEVEASPDISSDQPVYLQMEQQQQAYYSYSPMWDAGAYGGDGFGFSSGTMTNTGGRTQFDAPRAGDPHLRSLGEVAGYAIHALDGDIGHLEDFLVDDETWKLEFIVVDTKNWGFGNHVLIAADQVKEIDWASRYVRIDLTRYTIKSSPSWKEPDWSHPPAA